MLSRDRPNSSSITASDGSLSPVRRPRLTMSWTRSRAKASAVFSGRKTASPVRDRQRLPVDARRAARRERPVPLSAATRDVVFARSLATGRA